MAAAIYLGVGDGASADYLDLDNGTQYTLQWGTFTFEEGRFACRLDVAGATTDELLANLRALWAKLNQARLAAGPRGRGTPVVLSVRLGNASEFVYLDVLDGAVRVPEKTVTGAHIVSNWLQGVELVLACEPYARGDAIADAASATLTNGDGGALFRASVPGDVPALVQVKLVDGSTGSKVISRVRLGVRSDDDMGATDFDAVLDDTANSPGASSVEGDTVGGARSRVTTTLAWQDVADFAGGSAAYNGGEFDLWARVRHSLALGVPTGVAATQTSAGGLTAGTYTLKVTTLDGSGNESAPSEPLTVVVVGVEDDRIALTWDAGAGAANHRVYYKRDSDAWEYFATGSAAGSYNLDSNAGTAGDPPATSDLTPPQVRALVGLASLTTTVPLQPVTPALDNARWGLTYLGRAALPPLARGHELSDLAWKVTVQARATAGTPTVDVDALWLFPADEYQLVAEYDGLDLATQREWVLSTNRHGLSSGLLRSKADQSEQGQLNVTGAFYLPPGDCLVCVAVDIADGVSDVTDAKYTLALTITPRYRYLTGTA